MNMQWGARFNSVHNKRKRRLPGGKFGLARKLEQPEFAQLFSLYELLCSSSRNESRLQGEIVTPLPIKHEIALKREPSGSRKLVVNSGLFQGDLKVGAPLYCFECST